MTSVDGMAIHPSVAEKVEFLTNYNHLPEPLYSIARLIGDTAIELATTVESHPQLTIGLQHLIEAKDCIIRAKVAEVNRAKGDNPGAPLPRPDKVV